MIDRIGTFLGVAAALAAVLAAVLFLKTMGPVLDTAMQTAPAWLSLLALLFLAVDGVILYSAVSRISRHRLPVKRFLAEMQPALDSGDLEEAARICRSTGPRGVASLMFAWIQARDMDDLERKQEVARAALRAAKDLERDARAARLLSGLGALTGALVAGTGVIWSHIGSVDAVTAMHPFLLTLLGVILLLPSLGVLTFIASSVSKAAGELQAALPAIAGLGVTGSGLE